MNVTMTPDGLSLNIAMTRDELLEMGNGKIDILGCLTASAFKRKRQEMLCERDGHVFDGHLPEGIICSACWLVLDEERYEALVNG